MPVQAENDPGHQGAQGRSGSPRPLGAPGRDDEPRGEGAPGHEGAAGPTWSIAEVAAEFGVTHRTVRHYEAIGLISPERRGTQRVFHRRDRTRLALILRGKRLGFPLEEIRTIIDLYDAPRGRSSQLEYVLSQIDARRADLEQRRADLDAALSELDRFEDRCRTDLDRITGSGRDSDEPA